MTQLECIYDADPLLKTQRPPLSDERASFLLGQRPDGSYAPGKQDLLGGLCLSVGAATDMGVSPSVIGNAMRIAQVEGSTMRIGLFRCHRLLICKSLFWADMHLNANMQINVRNAVLLAALTLPLSGCLFRTRTVEPHVLTSAGLQKATTEQLVSAINLESARIRSLKATAAITASTSVPNKGKITEYREITGYLLVRKPGDLRLFGLVPVVGTRLFDMTSDGERFRMSIPVQNKFVTGSNNVTRPSAQLRENLRPQDIFNALLIRPIDAQREAAVLEDGMQSIRDPKQKKWVDEPTYVLSIIQKQVQGWYLVRRIIISRRDLRPQQQLIYDNDGSIVTEATYGSFGETQGIFFPMEIAIRRPKEGNTIRLVFTKLEMNPELRGDQFVLAQPPGSRLVDVDAPASVADIPAKIKAQPLAAKPKPALKPAGTTQTRSPVPPTRVDKSTSSKAVEPPKLTEITSGTAADSQLPHDTSLTTEQLLSKVEKDLTNITQQLTSDEQKLFEQVQLFIKESRTALDEGSAEKAHSLAVKASILSKELLR